MSDPDQHGLTICLTEQQVQTVNAWIGEINCAHFEEESLPPGFDLIVSFGGPWGVSAIARSGNSELQLGEVSVIPSVSNWVL